MPSHQKNRCKVPPHVEGCLFFYLSIHHSLVVYECLIYDFPYSLGSINVHLWGLCPLFQDWAHHRPLPWATYNHFSEKKIKKWRRRRTTIFMFYKRRHYLLCRELAVGKAQPRLVDKSFTLTYLWINFIANIYHVEFIIIFYYDFHYPFQIPMN